MTPTTHMLPVKNFNAEGTHRLAIYDWGKPDAQRVAVCVHGLTRNARDFDLLAQALVATGRRVLCISVAGRGESEWLTDPMGYNYGAYVADCIAVLDNFHLREVEWIGTSMGGIIGMMVAASNPYRIKKLIMNDIGAILSKEALERIYTYVRSMPGSFATRAAAEAYVREAFKPWGITDEAVWAQLLASSIVEREQSIIYACDPAIAAPLAAATENYTKIEDVNLSPIWAEVQTPTLILHGAESDILSADTIRAMRTTNLATESITFPGIGHAPALMSDDQIKPILNWLDRSLADRMAVSF